MNAANAKIIATMIVANGDKKLVNKALTRMKTAAITYNGFEPKNTVMPSKPGNGSMVEIAIIVFTCAKSSKIGIANRLRMIAISI